jgi:hypothetical protein
VTTAAASSDYFLEIEAHFAARRGTPFILSAKDWALMKKWFDDGVPLAVVIEAIDSVFEKNENSGRRKVISSLSYCRHAVKEIWQERQDLYAGSGEGTPEENVAGLLETLAAEVESSAPETAGEIRALVAEKSVPRVEEKLIAIEQQMMDRILSGLSPGERAEIEQPVTAIVSDAALDDKTRQRTWEANVRRRIRDRFGLPRLTLFR